MLHSLTGNCRHPSGRKTMADTLPSGGEEPGCFACARDNSKGLCQCRSAAGTSKASFATALRPASLSHFLAFSIPLQVSPESHPSKDFACRMHPKICFLGILQNIFGPMSDTRNGSPWWDLEATSLTGWLAMTTPSLAGGGC